MICSCSMEIECNLNSIAGLIFTIQYKIKCLIGISCRPCITVKKHQSNVKSDHFVNILHLYLWVIKKLSCFVQNEFTGTIYRGISARLGFLLISSIEKFCHSGKIFTTTSSQETDTHFNM